MKRVTSYERRGIKSGRQSAYKRRASLGAGRALASSKARSAARHAKSGPWRPDARTSPRKRRTFWLHVKKLRIRHLAAMAAVVVAAAAVVYGLVSAAMWGVRAIRVSSSFVQAVEVSFDGRVLGVVENLDMPQDVLGDIQRELLESYNMDVVVHQEFVAKPVNISQYNLAQRGDVAKALRSFIDAKVKAPCITIEGEPAVALRSEADAVAVLERIKKPYVDAAKDREITDVQFVEKVQIVEMEVPYAELKSPEEAYNLLAIGTEEKNLYTCVKGDTLWKISNDFGVSYSDIRKVNPRLAMSNVILVGMELNLIHPVNLVNVQCTEKVTRTEKLPFETETRKDDGMLKSQTKVVRAGVEGERTVVASVVRINGTESSRQILSQAVTKQAVNKVIAQGTKSVASSSSSSSSSSSGFIVPTSGYMSSPYGQRWGRLHAGVDIANDTGTPIYASKAGTVVRSGWYSGYGKCVDIDHGNGVVTRYGHNSVLKVSVGQKVSQGQLIALMGSTGNSTGPHCHFEIRINGSPIDPLTKIPRP